MGEHLIKGEFQSDKYPETPKGLVPLKPSDPMAQDLLAIYAFRRGKIDKEFSEDLLEALRLKGCDPSQVIDENGQHRLTYKKQKEKRNDS